MTCLTVSCDFRYTRQVIDETLRASVLAPWGARVHDFDLQVGEYVIPKEVGSNFVTLLYIMASVCQAKYSTLIGYFLVGILQYGPLPWKWSVSVFFLFPFLPGKSS